MARWTHKSIIGICRKPFGGLDDSLGRDDKKVKVLRFDRDLVDKVGKTFEAIMEIKILHQPPESEPFGPARIAPGLEYCLMYSSLSAAVIADWLYNP
jgi:hypothetical protein